MGHCRETMGTKKILMRGIHMVGTLRTSQRVLIEAEEEEEEKKGKTRTHRRRCCLAFDTQTNTEKIFWILLVFVVSIRSQKPCISVSLILSLVIQKQNENVFFSFLHE